MQLPLLSHLPAAGQRARRAATILKQKRLPAKAVLLRQLPRAAHRRERRIHKEKKIASGPGALAEEGLLNQLQEEVRKEIEKEIFF